MNTGTYPSNLWLRWSIANFGAVILAILAVLPLAVNLAYAQQAQWQIGLLVGAVLGVALGLVQGWMLRHLLPSMLSWIVITGIGAALGMALGMQVAEWLPDPASTKLLVRGETTLLALNTARDVAVNGAIFGLLLGGMQWLLLRPLTDKSGWWVIVNGVGWAIGLGGAALLVGSGAIGWLLIAGSVNGVVTGWLLRRLVWSRPGSV